MFSQLAAIIAPVAVCAGIGYLWARLRRPFETEFVTALVVTVGTPCLITSTLLRLPVDLTALGDMALAAIAVFAIVGAVAAVGLRAVGLPMHSYLPALLFPNAGNMGLPLCLFAFGEPGLALGIVFFTVSSVLQFTAGAALAAGTVSPARLARIPLLYAVAIALILMVTGTTLPDWITNTIELLGGLTIPLMLIALGVSLARLRIASLKLSLGIALVRLLLGFVVGLGVASLLGMAGMAAGVLVLQSSMPVAVFNYLFAQIYRRRPEEIAGAVVLSTFLSFASLPLLLLLVL
ncbi:MAG: AEC family transporter [Geminicoccaceae bacterium]